MEALRGPLPFKKFHTENFLSVNKSEPRPNKRKTRLTDLGSRYKLDTCGIVEYDICKLFTQDWKVSSLDPKAGIGTTNSVGISTSGGKHKQANLYKTKRAQADTVTRDAKR